MKTTNKTTSKAVLKIVTFFCHRTNMVRTRWMAKIVR